MATDKQKTTPPYTSETVTSGSPQEIVQQVDNCLQEFIPTLNALIGTWSRDPEANSNLIAFYGMVMGIHHYATEVLPSNIGAGRTGRTTW